MQISVAELAQDPDRYLDSLANEDIYITRNGKNFARLALIETPEHGIASRLFGILPNDANLGEARDERLAKS